MYFDGDIVDIKELDEVSKKSIMEALDAKFEDIEFYFVEYEGENAVVSAETDDCFAIIKCPRTMIEDDLRLEIHAEYLIDDMLRNSFDYALDTKNEPLFHALTEYAKSEPKKPAKELRPITIEFSDNNYDDPTTY